MCPLFGDQAAVVIAEEFVLRGRATHAGAPSSSRTSRSWRQLEGASRAVGLERARKHLANLYHFASVPQIIVNDVWAWGITS